MTFMGCIHESDATGFVYNLCLLLIFGGPDPPCLGDAPSCIRMHLYITQVSVLNHALTAL